MINVNLPEIPKEAAVYVVAAVVGAVLIFGVWSIGVASGARAAREEMQAEIDKKAVRISELEGKLTKAEADLIACKALKEGECILKCEPICRERVQKALDVRGALCSPSH
ncbi:MAG: hypothetical protein EBV86_09605 [Marivivens sp.]|nr:hypothetical protein [Marivivens sp.]NCW68810.1 hypothetical protein [Marivivens sp.]